ncbi:MAG: hypothetical protein AAF569_04100 [Pseudomonadota bacterium]
MGSLSSRPYVPSQPQIVYVPAPSQPATIEQTQNEEAAPSDEELASEVRQENLLRRSRGRFGTILSGFRGVFTDQGNTDGRKTLLGE